MQKQSTDLEPSIAEATKWCTDQLHQFRWSASWLLRSQAQAEFDAAMKARRSLGTLATAHVSICEHKNPLHVACPPGLPRQTPDNIGILSGLS